MFRHVFICIKHFFDNREEIQHDVVKGHSSVEDSTATMKLLQLKLKNSKWNIPIIDRDPGLSGLCN